MLKEDYEKMHKFYKIAIKDGKYDTFVDVSSKFIHELNNDMKIYFKKMKRRFSE